jgi:hypothetical protein
MSFQALAWAVEQKCSSSGQKLVLLMLANYCNSHSGQCNPSHQRLAEECCMGISTLKNHLSALSDMGLIRIDRVKQNGVNLPNQYWLNIDLVGQNLAEVGQNLAEGGSESDGGVGQNLATNLELKPGIEPISCGNPLSPSDDDDLPQDGKPSQSAPYRDLMTVYNEVLGEQLPKALTMNASRKQALKARWREMIGSVGPGGEIRYEDRESGINWWRRFFKKVMYNPHWMGANDRGWRADFDWIIKPNNFTKILEYRKG